MRVRLSAGRIMRLYFLVIYYIHINNKKTRRTQKKKHNPKKKLPLFVFGPLDLVNLLY